MKRFYLPGSLFTAALLALILAACPSPTDGGGGNGDDAIPVSGSIDPASLAALGLSEGQAVTVELRTSSGVKIAEVTVKSDGTWTASIPPEHKDSTITITLIVPTAGGGSRVLEGGTVTIDASGKAGTKPEITIDNTPYTISKAAASNGSFTVSRETALAGVTVSVTCQPDEGYRVKQITVNGVAVSVSAGTFIMPTGNVTVAVEFEAIPVSEPVSGFALDGLVTAPVRGAAAQSAFSGTDQYSGTIAWQTEDGQAHSGAFAASTVYRAVLNLTAKDGYTFTGVEADRFTYTGATAIANAANSGTVTITFPKTAAPGADTVINILALNTLVTAPVRGAQPQATFNGTDQYSGTIAWQTEDGETHSGAFAASTVYKAVLSLAAKSGYTFTGVAANSFTHGGATTVSNAANSGTVTITFPRTAASEGGDDVISIYALTNLVTAPVRGAAAQSAFSGTEEYTGEIAWQTEDGETHSGVFAVSTVYQAVLSLAAKSGYTFTGVAANSFTHDGATTVSNAANSGAVTITFPATAPDLNADIPIGETSVKLYRDGGANPLTHNGSTTVNGGDGTGAFTVSIAAGTYAEILWYLNGSLAAQGPGRTSISLRKQAGNSYQVTVEVTQGGVKNSGAHTFVVE